MQAKSKDELVGDLIARYRAATNRDVAFDKLAAARLGVSVTDLHCLNIVESRHGLTAGELAVESGLTTGAVTAVIDRLERAGFARRVRDERDRRKVKVEVTDAFYTRAADIWGPVAAEWQADARGALQRGGAGHDRGLPRAGRGARGAPRGAARRGLAAASAERAA